jgi:hypothetical protein
MAAIGGTIVALHYHRLDLTLSHYDARGHLVVARRIFDSLTPGWQQIGAVWLPLPHLLNALPVQVDAWYRSGASAVAISIAAFAVAVGALAWIVLQLTGSRAAAAVGAAVFALNPNVLYLQATPMTEPLLLGLLALAVASLMAWTAGSRASLSGSASMSPTAIGWLFALACLTRYEAWPVTAAALAAALWARWRTGEPTGDALREVAWVAVFPASAIAAFLILSRVVVGEWFVSSGFFVPDNEALGNPVRTTIHVWYGIHLLSGSGILALGAAGCIALAALSLTRPGYSYGMVALSLAATAALPWLAFIEGHPFRIRYMVPLIAVESIGIGVVAGLMPRARLAGLVLAIGIIAYELRPLDAGAPMLVEAQWESPNQPIRERVTACLGAPGSGEKIMASMGSLGHYMQEASHAGFRLRDFLHEGNGDIWLAALAQGPRAFVEWVMIEELAEGGDMLALRAREDPRFLDGYSRVCEGAGLALYRRIESR